MRKPSQRGMTLVELLIGVVIMAILLLAALPFTRSWIDSNRQMEVRSQLWEGISQARAQALRNPTATRSSEPAATLQLVDGRIEVIVPDQDEPTWSAGIRNGATLKLVDAGGFSGPDAMADSGNAAFDCVSFDSRGLRLPGADGCSDTDASQRRIAIGLADQEPLYVDML